LFSVKVFEPVLERSVGTVVVLPLKEPLNVYVPPGSFGVMVHEATPDALVVAEQDWVPLSVRVTVWPEAGVFD
jgi:hypothetical protein